MELLNGKQQTQSRGQGLFLFRNVEEEKFKPDLYIYSGRRTAETF